MVGDYVNKDMEKKMEELREWTEERDGQKVVIGVDFNTRTGREGERGGNGGGERKK